MKRIATGLFCLLLILTALPCFAGEGLSIRQTDMSTNVVAMSQTGYAQDGWYGPFYVSWLEYTLEDVYVEFTDGAWVVLRANRGYDIGAVAAIATNCKSHGHKVDVRLTNDLPSGLRVR